MRTIYFLLALPLLLGSCSLTKQEEKIDASNIEIPNADHEYFEVEDISINWNDILLQNNDTYYVYIYSLTCTHCQELKNWIIDAALNRGDIYFLRGSNKDVIKQDVSDTIGVTDVKDIAILGYPSLLKIKENTLVANIAGNSNIISILK